MVLTNGLEVSHKENTMTTGFVRGIPETPKVWDMLSARLSEAGHNNQVRLSPPGFAAPIPAGSVGPLWSTVIG